MLEDINVLFLLAAELVVSGRLQLNIIALFTKSVFRIDSLIQSPEMVWSPSSQRNSKTANLENTSLSCCGDQTILSHIVVFLF